MLAHSVTPFKGGWVHPIRNARPRRSHETAQAQYLSKTLAILSSELARLALLGPLEDGRAHAVPRAALGAVPIPADAPQTAVIALIPPARIADAREHRAECARLRARRMAPRELRQLVHAERRQRRREQPTQLPLAHAPGALQ